MNGLKIPHNAWVLVGDGEKAMILRNEGDEDYANLVVEKLFEHEKPLTKAEKAEGATDILDNAVRKENAHLEWHRLEKSRFAKEVADRLYKLAHAGRFQQLVIVAPPATLGTLRENLHQEVRNRVIAEVDKDLVRHPVYEIERLLTAA